MSDLWLVMLFTGTTGGYCQEKWKFV